MSHGQNNPHPSQRHLFWNPNTLTWEQIVPRHDPGPPYEPATDDELAEVRLVERQLRTIRRRRPRRPAPEGTP